MTTQAPPMPRLADPPRPGVPDVALDAARELADGRPIVLVDRSAEFAACIVLAAEHATARSVAFLVRHTSGFVCVAMTDHDLDRLDLPPMRGIWNDVDQLEFRVSVDAADGGTTGISAADRARTIRLLGAATTVAADFTRPGHVIPLRTHSSASACAADVAVRLCRLSGLAPAAAFAHIVTDNGTAITLSDVLTLCERHALRVFDVTERP